MTTAVSAGLVIALLLVGSCASPPAAASPGRRTSSGSSITVGEDGATQVLACEQSAVRVSGHHDVVTLTGTCGDVTVPGDDDQVTMEDASRVSVPGDGNTLSVRRVDAVSVAGHGNRLTLHSGSTRTQPAISDGGEGNVITTAG